MPICKKCGKIFKNAVKIDNKIRNLQRRKYCLICSPFGKHNTCKLHEIVDRHPCGKKKRNTKRDKFRYKKWQRKARRERKIKLIDMLGGECVQCGYCGCYKSFDFHHVNPSVKKFGISQHGLCRKWEDLIEEVKKCVLLCCRCHREIEAGWIKPKWM